MSPSLWGHVSTSPSFLGAFFMAVCIGIRAEEIYAIEEAIPDVSLLQIEHQSFEVSDLLQRNNSTFSMPGAATSTLHDGLASIGINDSFLANVDVTTHEESQSSNWSVAAVLGGIHAASTLLAIVVLFRYAFVFLLKGDAHEPSSVDQEERSALLDNVKWIAQLMVVYNHFLYFLATTEKEPWLHGSESVLLDLNGMFSFLVNPLFCFISGVVSQGPPTVKRVCRYVQYLIIPTLMFHFVVERFFPFLMNPNADTLAALPGKFAPSAIYQTAVDDPFLGHAPWYLLSLCVWRGSVYLIFSHMPKPVAFVCMCVVSCAGGYVALPGMGDGFHGYNATVSYLPYFGLGYIFPFRKFTQDIPKPSVAASMFVVAVIITYTSLLTFYVPYGVLPDGHGWYGCCGQDINAKLWWLRRLVKFIPEFTTVMLVIFLVAPRQHCPLTYVGSHTLYSYLFQKVAFSWRGAFFLAYPPPRIDSLLGHVAVIFLYYVPHAVVILLLFTSAAWRSLFRWALTPSWLDEAFGMLENRLSDYVSKDACPEQILNAPKAM